MKPKRNKNSNHQGLDFFSYFAQAIQDSALTILWEGFDRFKKEVKLRIEISLKSLLSSLVVATGLIFALVGMSRFLDNIISIEGMGYIFTGMAVVLAGIYFREKAKEIKKDN